MPKQRSRWRWILLLAVVSIILILRAFSKLTVTVLNPEASTQSWKTFTVVTNDNEEGPVRGSPLSVPSVTATSTRNPISNTWTVNTSSKTTTDTASPVPDLPTSLPIKTLVIVMGNLRCGELAWESLYQNVLDYNNHFNSNTNTTTTNTSSSSNNSNKQSLRFPHQLDLALAIGDPNASMYPNASLLSRAKFVFTFPEYGSDWSHALNLIDPDWKDTIAPLLANTSIVLGGIPYRQWHGSGAISFWIRWFLSQQLLQQDLVTRYDRFVITRTDHFYMCPHDLSTLDPRYLWVPQGQDFGGITDRHLIVPSTLVLAALDVLPSLFQNPANYPRLSDDYYNPEQLLWDRWKQQGLDQHVRRFPRIMFTCGNPTLDDATRWKHTAEVVPEGVRKKYRKEYLMSEATCKGDQSNSNDD